MNAFGNKSLVVIGVYLPQQRCKIAKFEDHLMELERLICILKPQCEICIVGDFNCHFGNDIGSRFWGKSTPNAKKLLHVVDTNEMFIIDSEHKDCKGPDYSFYVEGVGKSYVDHCIMSSHVKASVIDCDILEDCTTNTSDHLPITVSVATSPCTPSQIDDLRQEKVVWDKLDKEVISEKYTLPLEEEMSSIYSSMKCADEDCTMNEGNAECMITMYLDRIVDTIKRITSGMPKSKFEKHLKPYWNQKLTTANKHMKSVRRDWIRKGKRRGDDEAFVRLKEAKKSFRHCQHEAEKQYELKNMEDICTSQEIDEKFFWHLVNRHKKGCNSSHPIRLANGKVITDPEEIRDHWKIYFKELYTPENLDQYDNDFKLHVEEAMVELECQSYFNDDECMKSPITVNEVRNICNSLKCKKAPGWDGVTSEQLHYGGENLLKCLTWLFNKITLYEFIPCHFKRGIIIPIPKGNKDKQFQDNYRGITLIPVLAKLYEKCIMKRLDKSDQLKDVINILQGVTKARCSSLHVAWLVKEVISYHVEMGSNLYIGLLDIRKAYDTVWQDGMLYKLFHYGINGKTWRIIRNFYRKFMCQVRFKSLSELFEALQGIHQGAPCSTLFFALFENELLKIVQQLRDSIRIYDIDVSCPAFADDVSFIANSKYNMQKMFNIAYGYACKWRFEFSPQKCKVLRFGKDLNPKVKIKLGGCDITESKCETHLGVGLVTDKKAELEFLSSRISKCNPILFSMKSIGSKHVPLSPVTATKLYWSVCIPKLVYGFEVMDVKGPALDTIESFHCKAAKFLQGLPDQAVNIGSFVTIGWKPLEFHIDYVRLMFLWRILMLPMSNIYKTVLVRRIIHCVEQFNDKRCGPVKNILDTCIKYNLQSFVMDAIENASYCNMAQWKKMVRHLVENKYVRQVSVTKPLFKSLQYMSICCFMSPWWHYAHRCPSKSRESRAIVQLLLNKDRYVHSVCVYCDVQTRVNTHHILFDCSHFAGIREILWSEVELVGPPVLVQHLNEMSSSERCSFILNGFHTGYTVEWQELYMALSSFVFQMIKKYEKI